MAARTLKSLLASVTQAQIDRCHRIENLNTGETFYQVESESEPGTEYEVHFIPGKGFTCTCPAGLDGFHACAYGTCKHCRWAWAAGKQHKAEVAAEEHVERLVQLGLDLDQAKEATAHLLIVNGRAADDETLVRVWGAQGQVPDHETLANVERRYEGHPFSILR